MQCGESQHHPFAIHDSNVRSRDSHYQPYVAWGIEFTPGRSSLRQYGASHLDMQLHAQDPRRWRLMAGLRHAELPELGEDCVCWETGSEGFDSMLCQSFVVALT